MKIIYILHHSQLNYQKEIRCYSEDWHVRVAEQIQKRSSEYEIECWRPEIRLKELQSGQRDGITFKIFPSMKLGAGMEVSPLMMKTLKEYAKQSDILIHLHGVHYFLPWSIMNKFKTLPIVGQQHGDASSMSRYDISKSPFRIFYKIQHLYESNALKNVDHFFVLTPFEKDDLYRNFGIENAEIQTMGVDFTIFAPIEQKTARSLLGLPQDKKIILYVGRFFENKGIPYLITACQELKERYGIKLLLVGGDQSDPYYGAAKLSGADLIERIPGNQIVPYYSAADVSFIYMKSNQWGGVGIAPIESLACNTPLVSNTLSHVPSEERHLLGEIPQDENDISRCITKIFENRDHYNRCREIAEKYYSWDRIIEHTLEVYKKLNETYY